jgi:hypothetical protein
MKTNKHHLICPRRLVFGVIVGDEELLSTQVGVYVLVENQGTQLKHVYSSVCHM